MRLQGELINNVQNSGLREKQSSKNTSLCPTSNADELCQLELHKEIFSLPKTPRNEAALEKFILVTMLYSEGGTAEAN